MGRCSCRFADGDDRMLAAAVDLAYPTARLRAVVHLRCNSRVAATIGTFPTIGLLTMVQSLSVGLTAPLGGMPIFGFVQSRSQQFAHSPFCPKSWGRLSVFLVPKPHQSDRKYASC